MYAENEEGGRGSLLRVSVFYIMERVFSAEHLCVADPVVLR